MTNTNNFEQHGTGASDHSTSEPLNRFTKQAERLLREVPIVKVISEYTPLRTSKRGLIGNCPRHDEPPHTLRVDPRANTFYCTFCGVRGNAISFLQMAEELTSGQALEALEAIKYSDESRDAA